MTGAWLRTIAKLCTNSSCVEICAEKKTWRHATLNICTSIHTNSWHKEPYFPVFCSYTHCNCLKTSEPCAAPGGSDDEPESTLCWMSFHWYPLLLSLVFRRQPSCVRHLYASAEDRAQSKRCRRSTRHCQSKQGGKNRERDCWLALIITKRMGNLHLRIKNAYFRLDDSNCPIKCWDCKERSSLRNQWDQVQSQILRLHLCRNFVRYCLHWATGNLNIVSARSQITKIVRNRSNRIKMPQAARNQWDCNRIGLIIGKRNLGFKSLAVDKLDTKNFRIRKGSWNGYIEFRNWCWLLKPCQHIPHCGIVIALNHTCCAATKPNKAKRRNRNPTITANDKPG